MIGSKSFRKLKSISIEQFESDVLGSPLSGIDANESAISSYTSVLSQLLDSNAPVKTRSVTIHLSAPWYTYDIDLAKKERRG